MSHHFDLEEENDWIALSESLNARSIKATPWPKTKRTKQAKTGPCF